MKLVLDRDLFNSLAPKGGKAMLFNPGDEVKLINLDVDNQLEWGKGTVPAISLEVNGKPLPEPVPVAVILGAVVNKPGIIFNSEMGALECVSFVGNTLHDYLKLSMDDDATEIELPETIKVIKRVNKGVAKSQIDNKKALYEESFLIEEGNTFDETFAELEFIPTVFKSDLGVIRTNGTYVIAELD